MQIHIESTPNTNAKKFNIIGLENKIQKSHFLRSNKQAQNYSTVAVKLFEIQSISTVFLFQDFITITKTTNSEWSSLEKQILDIIYTYINSYPKSDVDLLDIYHKNDNNVDNINQNSSTPSSEQNNNTTHNTNNVAIISKIEELIATRIRPSVAQDGGDIIFHSYNAGIVKVILTGACNGCEQSHITLKKGVESLLKYYIPSIKSVECTEDEDLLNNIT